MIDYKNEIAPFIPRKKWRKSYKAIAAKKHIASNVYIINAIRAINKLFILIMSSKLTFFSLAETQYIFCWFEVLRMSQSTAMVMSSQYMYIFKTV